MIWYVVKAGPWYFRGIEWRDGRLKILSTQRQCKAASTSPRGGIPASEVAARRRPALRRPSASDSHHSRGRMNLELFGCSGGMAEGFRRAGITFDFCFDSDLDACASYETNLGHAPIQIDVRDLLRMARAGWSPGPIELLVADPPCTPWSRAGKRKGLDDERDLLAETCELISILRPRAYLIANVPGLDDGPHLAVVQRLIGGLWRHGYCVADFARLDAADYGVPQHRHRPFWFGHRGGQCLTWPVRTHGPSDGRQTSLIEPLRPWVTCREALGHLPLKDLGRPVRLRKRGQHSAQHGSVPERPARVVGTSNLSDGNVLVMRQRANGGIRESFADEPAKGVGAKDRSAKVLLAHPKHPINRPDEPSFTVMQKGEGRGAVGASAITWPWCRPATTVTAHDTIGPPGHHTAGVRMMPDAVVLSERAAAILQGFPERWHFAGQTKASRWAQIGMAIPPPLAEAVARCVARWFEVHR